MYIVIMFNHNIHKYLAQSPYSKHIKLKIFGTAKIIQMYCAPDQKRRAVTNSTIITNHLSYNTSQILSRIPFLELKEKHSDTKSFLLEGKVYFFFFLVRYFVFFKGRGLRVHR